MTLPPSQRLEEAGAVSSAKTKLTTNLPWVAPMKFAYGAVKNPVASIAFGRFEQWGLLPLLPLGSVVVARTPDTRTARFANWRDLRIPAMMGSLRPGLELRPDRFAFLTRPHRPSPECERVAAILQTIAGAIPRFPPPATAPVPVYTDETEPVKAFAIGIPRDYSLNGMRTPRVATKLKKASSLLKKLGC